ncbi:hypothetical protein CPB86DRAFT_49208 [Serendipita vermifera]|nr:hypothetical protein CPB86DRAFT_49208 [Serendipita vermifera]
MAFIDNTLTSSGGTMTHDEEHRHLTDIRWRRMSEIKRLRDGEPAIGTEGHRILQAKIAAYNEAVNSLRDYNYRLGIDPMDKLPEELWIKILKYCMWIKGVWDTRPFVESVLVLTLVSKRWRAFILSEPSFWNKVALTNHHDDASMTVLVSLSLSRNLPLTLYIDLPFRGWAEVRSEMLEHHNRIENIVMSGMYSFEMHAKKRRHVKRLLEYLHPLSSRKRLGDAYETSETEYDAVWILKRFSEVSHLPNLALTKDALLLAKRLRAVHTYERIDDIFPMLEVLPNLKKVVFWDDSNVNMANGRSPTRESPPSPNPLHWSSFAYHCIRPKLPISVLQRLLFLTSLEFVGGFGLLTDAIAILHSFKKLRRFATHLSLDDKEEKSPPNLIFPCPTVRSFVITVHHRNQPTPNPTNDGRLLVRKYRVLRDMLSESMP